MDRRRFLIGSTAAAASTIAAPAIVRAATEITFYYPVAVGGPITKTIDGYAADFEKENPGISVKPIYAGTYQETMVKALTAHKSGNPPTTCVLLSTDMFSLIDEEAIVPFDDFAQIGRRKKLDQELLPGLHAKQPDRRKDLGHSVPAFHHRAVLEQGSLQGRRASILRRRRQIGPTSSHLPRSSPGAMASGNTTPMGDADPLFRFSLLAVPGAHDPERRHSDE